MEQRKSARRRSSDGTSNRNMRSINNSREVSRRAKGKNRYAYEEDRRSARYYDDEEDYYRERPKKKSSSNDKKKRRPEEDYQNIRKMSDPENNKNRKNKRRRGRKKNRVSRTIGIILAIIQFILSVVLAVNVMLFNVLTSTYFLVLIGVLLILLGITLLTQIAAKGKGIGGKIFCILICIILGVGSFYIGKVNNAFQKITGSNKKTSSMVVAVKADDNADTLSAAAEYTFGVQYATGGDQTKSAVKQIEKELGQNITLQEYSNLGEEAQALYDGEVDAIIYNSAYSNIIKEQYSTFTKDTKVIYKHNIVVEIESDTSDESVTKPFAVYLSGIDTNGDITEQGRSDVNIVAVVNPTSHQVLLITTPRDYYVPIPGVSGGQDDKLTHAGIYGVDVSMQTLEELYDTDIEFFGRVNFTSMTSVVDALGGLDVESDLEFDTGWESGAEIHVNEGMNHFDGISALAFCRERQALPDGDNGRGVHQQAVITAIIKKMMSPAMLRGASDIIESVSDGVDTNFTSSQIQSLIKTQLRTNAKWNIYSVAADGTGGTDSCYSSGDEELYVTYPDENSVAEIIGLIKKVKDGEIIEGSVSTE